MVQKIHPRIWVPSIQPLAGHLPEENDDLAVQYEDVRALSYSQVPNKRAAPFIVFFFALLLALFHDSTPPSSLIQSCSNLRVYVTISQNIAHR